MGLRRMVRWDCMDVRAQKESFALRRRGWIARTDSLAWQCGAAGALAALFARKLFAIPSSARSSIDLQQETKARRTTSSFALFIRLKLSLYSSNSVLKFFKRSKAFSCFVCTGSCFASLE